MLRKLILVFSKPFSWGFVSIFFTILAFPKYSVFALAFFAFIPFLFTLIKTQNKKSVFFKIFAFSILANFLLVLWIIPTFRMANISYFVAALACFFIASYLAIYWVIFFGIFYLCRDKYYRVTYLLFLSAVWVLLEYCRSYFLTGFPWNLLGYTQWNNILFIQVADITGVYGISFLVIFVNLYLTSVFFDLKNLKKLKKKNFVLVFLILFIVLGYGIYRLNNLRFEKKEPIKFAVLQGNIEQYKKFDMEYVEFIRNSYTSLVNSKDNSAVDIFVWPETSYPFAFPNKIEYFFKDFKPNTCKNILGVFIQEDKKAYNSAVFLNGDYTSIDYYHKMHLVPFGERFLFKDVLYKLIPNLPDLGGIDPGQKIRLFDYKNQKIAVNICFESLFPNEMRKFVKNGGNILVNISNDAWYLDTSAPYQHFSFNIFRAVENRRYLLRAANTGISALIDPYGRVLDRTGLYVKARRDYKIRGIDYQSFYTRYGDVFVYICIFFVGLFGIKKITRRGKK